MKLRLLKRHLRRTEAAPANVDHCIIAQAVMEYFDAESCSAGYVCFTTPKGALYIEEPYLVIEDLSDNAFGSFIGDENLRFICQAMLEAILPFNIEVSIPAVS